MTGQNPEPLRIYVSAWSADLTEVRQSIANSLDGLLAFNTVMGQHPVLFRDRREFEASLEKVRSCDAAVVILGQEAAPVPVARVGGLPPISMVSFELDEARRHGIPVFAFLLDSVNGHPTTEGPPLGAGAGEDSTRSELRALRSDLGERASEVHEVEGPKQLSEKTIETLVRWAESEKQQGLLEQILSEGRFGGEDTARARDLIMAFVRDVRAKAPDPDPGRVWLFSDGAAPPTEGTGNVGPAPPTQGAEPAKGDPLPTARAEYALYRPSSVAAGKPFDIIAYVYAATSPVEQAPTAPPRVQEDAEGWFSADAPPAGTATRGLELLAKEDELVFRLDLHGCSVHPAAQVIRWSEAPFERSVFRCVLAEPLAPAAGQGRLSVFRGPLLVAEVNFEVAIGPGSDLPEPMAGSGYRRIFPSYSHQDRDLVDLMEACVGALGDRYLRDVTTLRSGEVWSDRVAELIETSDVFQLFWSSRSMRSQYVRTEWEHAVALGRSGFVRPVYWEDPLPRTAELPPPSLAKLHFSRISVPAKSPPERRRTGGGAGSFQKRRLRTRPTRVNIAYEISTGGARQLAELPFVVGVLADLSGDGREDLPDLNERTFVEISRDNFDAVMKSMSPRLQYEVRSVLGADSGDQIEVSLTFERLEDFSPKRVVEQVEPLRELLARRDTLAELAETEQGHRSKDEIRAIDGLLRAQVSAILYAPSFRKLEAAWRGLRYLVCETETGPHLMLRVLSLSKDELRRDLTTGQAELSLERSRLFQRVHDAEFNEIGGTPYGLLLGDFEFGREPSDVALLTRMAELAAASHAPFVSGVSPAMFGVESFTAVSDLYDIGACFESDEYSKWKAFRQSADARYVALTLPRMLVREPYADHGIQTRAFGFSEASAGGEGAGHLWANASWGLAACVTRAFAKHGWCARIRGPSAGGRVENLPAHRIQTDVGQATELCPTEAPILERSEFELSSLGFVPLANESGTANAVFYSVPSCHDPSSLESSGPHPGAAASVLESQIPYVITASRFAHYLMALTRDRVGSFGSRQKLEEYLNEWISGYVFPHHTPSPHERAKRPLRTARIVVIERYPGRFSAEVVLEPLFQLNEVTTPVRLIVDLPDPMN